MKSKQVDDIAEKKYYGFNKYYLLSQKTLENIAKELTNHREDSLVVQTIMTTNFEKEERKRYG